MPKSRKVSVILINFTNGYIWIRQPSLAADLHETEIQPWQYGTVVYQKKNEIKFKFQTVATPEIEREISVNLAEVTSAEAETGEPKEETLLDKLEPWYSNI